MKTNDIYNEVKKRFNSAYVWEVDYLKTSEDPSDWRFITLLMTARYYRILSDVITDLIHYKWEGGDTLLENHEIPNFVESLTSQHPELLEITERSMEDLKQTLKRNIKDGGLLEKVKGRTFRITAPGISYELKQLYLNQGSSDDLIFMLLKSDEIKRIKGI